jgi:hypothetical protein
MEVGYLRYIPEPLLDDIVSSRCIPIVGAGFSINAKSEYGPLPTWDKLGYNISKLIPNYEHIHAIDSISAFTYLNGKTRLAEYLSKFLLVDHVQPGKSHISFANLYFKEIITTNFDFLIEAAMRQLNNNYRIVMEESQLPLSSAIDEKLILKIHGDIHHPERLIATEEDYDKFVLQYPLLSTYISNLLISKTALFIGYSLNDPDFRQLFQILKNRLGGLRRPAYVILVCPDSNDVMRYERRGIQVISIPGEITDYDIMLSSLFSEIRSIWDKYIEENRIVVNEKSESTLSLPKESKSKMCFVYIPSRLLTYYKSFIYPYLEKYGFSPVSTTDIMTNDENFFAKLSFLIQRAELIIAEPGDFNDAVNQEYFLTESNRNILMINEFGQPRPLLTRKVLWLERPVFPSIPDEQFIKSLEKYLKSLSAKLTESIESEPERLLEKNEFRAAVISSFVILESQLRELAFLRLDAKGILPLSKLLDMLVIQEILPVTEKNVLREWLVIRNQLIHTNKSIDSIEAKKIVSRILEIVKKIKARKNEVK